MDVNNNSRINNQNIQGVSSQKSGEYIPVLHAKTEDTVELSTSSTKKKKKGFLGNLVNKIKDLAQDAKASKYNKVSNEQESISSEYAFGIEDDESETVPERTIKDEVKDFLETVPMKDASKKYLLEDNRVEYMLPLLTKYMAIPDIEQKIEFVEQIGDILYYVETPQQAKIVDKFLSEPKLYENNFLWHSISTCLWGAKWSEKESEVILSYLDVLLNDEITFDTEPEKALASSMLGTVKTDEQLEMAKKIIVIPELCNDYANSHFCSALVTLSNSPERLKITSKIISTPELYKNEYIKNSSVRVLNWIDSDEKAEYINKFLSSPLLYENVSIRKHINNIIECSNVNSYEQDDETIEVELLALREEILDKYLENPKLHNNEFIKENVDKILSSVRNAEQYNVIEKFLSTPELYEKEEVQEKIFDIVHSVQNTSQALVADKVLSCPKLFDNEEFLKYSSRFVNSASTDEIAKLKLELLDRYNLNISDKDSPYNVYDFWNFASSFDTEESAKCRLELLDLLIGDNETKESIGVYYRTLNSPMRLSFAYKLMTNSAVPKTEILKSIYRIHTVDELEIKNKFVDMCLSEPEIISSQIFKDEFAPIVFSVDSEEKIKYAQKLFNDVKTGEVLPNIALLLIQEYGKVSFKEVSKLRKTVGDELFNTISQSKNDVVVASKLVGLYSKNNINEIALADKRNVLKALITCNADMFSVSDEFKKAFPLIPTNTEEYCTLVPSLVKSLGIEVKNLNEAQVSQFSTSIDNLSSILARLSDEDFNDLEISNSYSKNEFIKDTLSIVANLPTSERQKVYDYFGFELHKNKSNPTGFSIEGYPVNINNGAKLAQITDENTKQVVEQLRQKVIAFSENNSIKSNNVEVAKMIDEIMVALPELRSLVGKSQSEAYDFDLFKQSLKVIQKTVQNPNYASLDESDKKIMLLASLLHDVNKAEGKPDLVHPNESSFDAFYIAKKFNLSKEEQIKLYTLINHHEWLKHVNKQGLSPKEQTKRLQSVAFDLQNDNLFEMAKILTESDLKSVKASDELYETYKADLEMHSEKIEEYIEELKKSKPILPTTTLPKATDIQSRITVVNYDCSTNLKGVYVKDGIVVVKYNEVEDWESLGFPKWTISKGIETVSPVDNSLINTGNIKFIAHGLTYANQLSNFDAFALPDSDALLSVSYMERPESKYRLFRTQGVLLDVDSKYIHGGGNTDSGSGCGKDISNFKSRYIFGGERQKDRDYISDLIKETLQLNDEEYIAFIEANQNKSMLEIEPVEVRDALIKKFALINSNTRRGNRAYNEMYVSNPKVQGCFAYSPKDKVGEISDFMDSQPEFLKDYAKGNNLPFFVFGD